jgi:hypothetical protein
LSDDAATIDRAEYLRFYMFHHLKTGGDRQLDDRLLAKYRSPDYRYPHTNNQFICSYCADCYYKGESLMDLQIRQKLAAIRLV